MKPQINAAQALTKGITNFVIGREPKAFEDVTNDGMGYISVQGQFGEFPGSLFISAYECANFMEQLGIDVPDLTPEIVNGLNGKSVDLYENKKGYVTFKEQTVRE